MIVQNIRIEVDPLCCSDTRNTRHKIGSVVRRGGGLHVRVENNTHFGIQVDAMILNNLPEIGVHLDHFFTKWRVITGPINNPHVLFDVELN